MAMNKFQSEMVTTLVVNKTKIVNRVTELKEIRDKVVSFYGTDKYHSIIFNRLTDTINLMMGQVQDINIKIDEIRTSAGLEPLYSDVIPLYGKKTG